MSAIGGWAIEALVASTVLMLAVMLLRAPVRRAFGPDIAYALWALPVLRLALPPLPARWHEVAVAPVLRATERVTVLWVDPIAAPLTGAPAAPPGAPSVFAVLLGELVPALAVLWIGGAAAFALWHIVAHRRFCARMLGGCAARRTVDGVAVIETAATTGPLAFGIWRRYVALPVDVAERYDAEERDLALAHELGHHARGDLIANWVALAVLALHWFNPVAWRAFRLFRADQEIANDARVLGGMSPMRRHAYACAIVKTAHPAAFGAPVSTACHLHTIEDLKGRLRMLTTTRVSRLRLLAGGTTVAALIAAGLGLTASGTAAVAAARTTVEAAAGVDLGGAAQVVAAPLPAPPAPPVDSTPSVAPVPAAPATAATPGASGDAAAPRPRTVRKVIVTSHGTTTTYDNADVDAHLAAGDKVAIAPLSRHSTRMIIKDPADPDGRIEVQEMPAISSANCGIGTGTPASMVVETAAGQKRKIVICTDRIRRVTADAMAHVGDTREIERGAYRSALAGLRKARAEMAAQTGPESGVGLPALDAAIAEVERDLANVR